VSEVVLVAPQFIASMQKKHEIEIPNELNKYQHIAYITSVFGG